MGFPNYLQQYYKNYFGKEEGLNEKDKRIQAYGDYAAIRDASGLTDYAVAKRSGVHQSVFSDWKTGKSMPKIDKMVSIASALNCNINDLLRVAYETADNPPQNMEAR